jgi:hypothetical protein
LVPIKIRGPKLTQIQGYLWAQHQMCQGRVL